VRRSGLLCCVVLASRALGVQPDAAALVKESIANHERDWREGAEWRYRQVDVTHAGAQKHVEVSEVTPLHGTPYERLVAKDGHALSAEEQKKEDQKYEKASERRQKESPGERAARLRKRDQEWTFLKDLPHAYNFAILGEEAVNARPAWIVEMTPRAGFTPTTSRGAMLKHIQGKLWIDKHDVQWVKAEAHVVDTIEIGWVLARVGPGAEIRLTMKRVADGLWLPGTLDIEGNAKVMMVHRKSLNEQLAFSDYARTGRDRGVQVSGTTPAKPIRQ
jgi:hypothetical protein